MNNPNLPGPTVPGAPTPSKPPMKPATKGCIGCLFVFGVLFLIVVIGAAFGSHGSGHSGAGWDHKGVASVKQAGSIVGGWPDDETKNLYARGLQHIANKHQKPGSFTIGQVVDQERSRRGQRAEMASKQQEAAKSAKEEAQYKKAFAELKGSEEAANRLFGFAIYQGYKADELGVHIIIDANHYEYMSQQDQHRFNAISVGMWSLSLRHLYGYDVPFERRRVLLENEAGDELYHDVVGQPSSRERGD